LKPDLDAGKTAALYSKGGAAAVSILTDGKFFHGSFEDLATAAEATPDIPRLCKDFVLDAYQIPYARMHQADAILLIAALHSVRTLTDLIGHADRLGMDCLVEVHDEAELDRAREAGARIIGVNSRDLRDFSVNLETAERLGGKIGQDIVKVAESGISRPEHIVRLRECGYNCFLIGEALVTADDPVALLSELVQS
jgi:indole-3-glycerol phosphate synthase